MDKCCCAGQGVGLHGTFWDAVQCKDRQIAALQAMNVAWKEYSYAMQRYYQSLKWGSSEITSKNLAEFGRTQEVLRKMGVWEQEEGK